jgi:hypothetical protein
MKQTNLFGEEIELKEKINNGYTGKYNPTLEGGYLFDEVASALQKSIRRGKERDATFWAAILYKSGFHRYLKKRLWIIVHEDIGIANPTALLYANQLKIDVEGKKRIPDLEKADPLGYDFLQIVNLIILSCRGQKTRIADNLTELVFNQIDKRKDMPDIPEIAKDPHTDSGKQQHGRWNEGDGKQRFKRIRLWYDHWSKVINELEPENNYKKEMKKTSGYYGKSDDGLINLKEAEIKRVLAELKTISVD